MTQRAGRLRWQPAAGTLAGSLRPDIRGGAGGALGQLLALKLVNYYSQTHPWDQMWANYNGATIRADLATIKALGANGVSCIVHADTTAFAIDGAVPSAAMLAHLTDYLSAARDAGLYVVVKLYDLWSNYTSGTAITDSKNWIDAVVGAFPSGHTVIGAQLKNEVAGTEAGLAAWIAGVVPYAAARLGVPWSISVANSSFSSGGADGCDNLRNLIVALNGLVPGFQEIHFYHAGISENYPGYLATAKGLMPGVPIVNGEFGVSTDWGSTQAAPGIPTSFPLLEAAGELYYRSILLAAQEAGVACWPWMLWDIPGVEVGAVCPTLSQAAGSSAFASGNVVYVGLCWTNSAGTTAVSASQSITIAANGNSISVPAQVVPSDAGGLRVYVSQAAGSTTLKEIAALAQSGLVPGTNCAAVTITGFGTGAVAPAAATCNDIPSNLTVSTRPYEYARGLYRNVERGGGLKPHGVTLQNYWKGVGAISTLLNLGFESVGADPSGVNQPLGWREVVAGNVAFLSDAVTYHAAGGGARSLKLNDVYNTGGSHAYARMTPVQPIVVGQSYTFTAYVKTLNTPGSNADAEISVVWANISGTTIRQDSSALMTTDQNWQQLSVTGVAPAGTALAYLQLQVKNGNAGSNNYQVWFDDLTWPGG